MLRPNYTQTRLYCPRRRFTTNSERQRENFFNPSLGVILYCGSSVTSIRRNVQFCNESTSSTTVTARNFTAASASFRIRLAPRTQTHDHFSPSLSSFKRKRTVVKREWKGIHRESKKKLGYAFYRAGNGYR